jgi:hypothetical protein
MQHGQPTFNSLLKMNILDNIGLAFQASELPLACRHGNADLR